VDPGSREENAPKVKAGVVFTPGRPELPGPVKLV